MNFKVETKMILCLAQLRSEKSMRVKGDEERYRDMHCTRMLGKRKYALVYVTKHQ